MIVEAGMDTDRLETAIVELSGLIRDYGYAEYHLGLATAQATGEEYLAAEKRSNERLHEVSLKTRYLLNSIREIDNAS